MSTREREIPIPGTVRGPRSFLRGVARLVTFGAFPHDADSEETGASDDAADWASDWEAVGGDLRAALRRAAIETGIPELVAAERGDEHATTQEPAYHDA